MGFVYRAPVVSASRKKDVTGAGRCIASANNNYPKLPHGFLDFPFLTFESLLIAVMILQV